MSTPATTYPTFRQGLGLLMMFILMQIVLELVPKMIATQIGWKLPESGVMYQVFEVIRYLLMYGVVILIGYRGSKRKEPGSKVLYFKATGVAVTLLIIIAFCFETVIEDAILHLLPPIPKRYEDVFKDVSTLSAFSIILAVIVAPVCEEIIFRGIILEGFLKRFHAPAAIVLSSFLFGLMHLNIWQGVSAFTGGLLLGWIYHRSRSLLPCILLHALNNLLSVWLASRGGDINTSLQDMIGNPWYAILLSSSVTGFIVTIYFLNKRFKSAAT